MFSWFLLRLEGTMWLMGVLDLGSLVPYGATWRSGIKKGLYRIYAKVGASGCGYQ